MPLTVLIADDDLGTRLSVSDYLESQGYIVVSTDNGKDALALAQTHHPHLVITDIGMPQMDGYELVRQMRRSPEMRLLPVIFLTGKAEIPSRVMGYQLGCDAYLAKPFEFVELGAIVRNLLDRSQILMDWRLGNEPPLQKGASAPVTVSGYPDAEPSIPLRKQSAKPLSVDLSQREQEVLTLLSQGLSNNQIGEYLHLSPRTIEKHVSSLLRKTETGNRAELVRYAVEHHLLIEMGAD